MQKSTIRRLAGLATVLTILCLPAVAGATDRHATTANFAATYSAAVGGDTVLLASGGYGTFAGSVKASRVTIRPESGATASMRVSYNGASNITLDGLTITDLDMAGTTKNVTVSNSTFTGAAVIRTDQMNNANVLFDHNTHNNIGVCSGCFEGRVHLPGSGPNPAGVTIQNSTFDGGDSDGIQTGANGVMIRNNTFSNILFQGGPHSDSLQMYRRFEHDRDRELLPRL